MHSLETRNEFLKLRVQGLSFNRIATQLGVSKPTLIAWSRQRHPEIQAQQTDQALTGDEAFKLSNEKELADLARKATAIRQEINSRTLRPLSTEQLHALLSHLEQKLQNLQPVKKTPSPTAPIQTQNFIFRATG